MSFPKKYINLNINNELDDNINNINDIIYIRNQILKILEYKKKLNKEIYEFFKKKNIRERNIIKCRDRIKTEKHKHYYRNYLNNKYENDVEFREKTKQRNKEANKLKRQNTEPKKIGRPRKYDEKLNVIFVQ